VASQNVYEIAFRLSAALDERFRTVFSGVDHRITDLERRLNSFNNIGRRNGGFGRGIVTGLTQIGKAAGVAAGVAIAGGIYAAGSVVKDSVSKAMDFESQLSTIQALTGATNQEMNKMQALALKMGANTKYNALEAAQGIEELLKAGLTPAAVQAGGLEAALNLATAGSLDLASAAEIMSTALNAYRDDNMSAAQAANILAGTANASATSVEELRYSLSMVSAVASGVGTSFEDTNVALGLFANNGLKGSDAGTSLKTMLMNLNPATKSARKAMAELGLITEKGANVFYNANGELKSLEEISGILRKSLSKLNAQQRQAYLKEMFGTDAIRAANILYKEGAEGVANFRKEMSKVTALDVAKKKMDNAAGAVEQFRGALETLQISALMPTMPIIKDLALAAADFVEKYTPQITAGIERMVNRARNYLSERFFNNPEFQQLDLSGKVSFVAEDLGGMLSTWLRGEQAAKIAKVGADIGGGLITTAGKAAFGAISNNPTLSLLLGGYLGLRSGPIGVVVALSVIAPVWIKKFLDYADQKLEPYTASGRGAKIAENVNSLYQAAEENSKKNPGQPLFKGGEIKAPPKKKSWLSNWWENGITLRATGGYVTKPELAMIGEGRSPEWIIPDERSPRSRGLLAAANESIGFPGGSGGGDFVFSPTYNFYGNADQEAVKQMEQAIRRDFEREFNAYKAQQRRLSMA